MKTLFAILFLGFAVLFPGENAIINSQDQIDVAVHSEAASRTQIKLYIEYGRRINGRCIPDDSRNICDAYVGTKWGYLNFTALAEKLLLERLQFNKKSLSPEIISRHFPNNIFMVEEDFSKKIRYKGKSFLLKLKAGKYKVKETKTSFLLDLPG